MVASCSAYNCTRRQKVRSGVSFHRFPLRNEELLKRWLVAIRRKEFVPTRFSFICSKHFVPQDFEERPYGGRPTLRRNAVPSIFNFSNHRLKQEVVKKSSSRRNALSSHSTSDHCYSVQENKPRRYVVFSFRNEEELQCKNKDEKTFKAKKRRKGKSSASTAKNCSMHQVETNDTPSFPKRRRYVKILKQIPDDENQSPSNKKHVVRRKTCEKVEYQHSRTRSTRILQKKQSNEKITIDEEDLGQVEGGFEQSSPEEGSVDIHEAQTKKNKLHCFVCNREVAEKEVVGLNILTEATKTKLVNKLNKIVEESGIVVMEEYMLCKNCTQLLNYFDHLEVEICMLKKSILRSVTRNHLPSHINPDSSIQNQTEEEYQCNNLNDDATRTSCNTEYNDEACGTHLRNTKAVDISRIHSYASKRTENKDILKCSMCSYKADCKSRLVHHLRKHSSRDRFCDFYGSLISPKGTEGPDDVIDGQNQAPKEGVAIQEVPCEEAEGVLETENVVRDIPESRTSSIVNKLQPVLTSEKVKVRTRTDFENQSFTSSDDMEDVDAGESVETVIVKVEDWYEELIFGEENCQSLKTCET